MKAVLIRTGTANLASVRAGLIRAGVDVELTLDSKTVREAPLTVLPGVGAFGASVLPLREHGLDAALKERIAAEKPTLAVCVGLQLLCSSSEESPGADGLGVLPVHVTRFGDQAPTVPQLGWNRIETDPGCEMLEQGYAYFANSYKMPSVPEGWRAAWAEHGDRFVAAVERGPVLACQFHPELSGALGKAVLGRWVARAREVQS
ncbi:MAG: imidazole glycerol phosphate synthase subunit HisH [Myxococcota bacterium]